jgi:hypothetical protein
MVASGKVWNGSAWVSGIQVHQPMSYYPSHPARWLPLSEGVTAPAVWDFAADAQGWTGEGLNGPIEWQPADGRILGPASGLPSFFAADSLVQHSTVRLQGHGPWKIRATVAALQISGRHGANALVVIYAGMNHGYSTEGTTDASTQNIVGSTGWFAIEGPLWSPATPSNGPYESIAPRVWLNSNSSLMGDSGDADWRLQVNDVSILNPDGSPAQMIVADPIIGKVWNGAGWVDFV